MKSKNDAKALPPPLVNSEVNNGASSSGLQTLTKNKLKYKGQEFVPGKLWAARGAGLHENLLMLIILFLRTITSSIPYFIGILLLLPSD